MTNNEMKNKEMENKAVLPEELNEDALMNVNGGGVHVLKNSLSVNSPTSETENGTEKNIF